MRGRDAGDWLFPAPGGGPLRNSNFRPRRLEVRPPLAGRRPGSTAAWAGRASPWTLRPGGTATWSARTVYVVVAADGSGKREVPPLPAEVLGRPAPHPHPEQLTTVVAARGGPDAGCPHGAPGVLDPRSPPTARR